MLAVLGALFANGLITVLKFIAVVITGSSGMVLQTNEEIEDLIKRAEPKVEMIFLETARASDSTEQNVVPEHMA